MVAMRLGLRPFLMFVAGRLDRPIVEDLDDIVVHETLQRLMIHIGVSDRTLLNGPEVEHLATG